MIVRGLLFANVHPKPHTFYQMKAPAWWAARRAWLANLDTLHDIVWHSRCVVDTRTYSHALARAHALCMLPAEGPDEGAHLVSCTAHQVATWTACTTSSGTSGAFLTPL